MPPIVQHRRGTLASLTAANEIPNAGEIYFETDTNKLKVGDGSTPYNSLPYIVGGAGGGSGGSALNRTLDALTFNGSTTTFNLVIGSTAVTPSTAASLLIMLNGVVQRPDVAYTVSGSTITFSVAPATTDTFFGVYLAGSSATFNSPTQITANQNNYALSVGANNVRLSTDAARTITGFVAESGSSVTLHNVGSFPITIAHESTSSVAANRVISTTGADLTIPVNSGITITYDGTTARWRATAVVRSTIESWWAASSDKSKLDGIATGATANATDAQLRDRTTHTGSQTISTVTGLQAALDGKQAAGSYAASVHAHVVGDVSGLQAALDSKQVAGNYAASTHGHSIADVSGLQTELNSKQPVGSYAPLVHQHTIANVSGLQAALDGKQATGDYATLVGGKVPAGQLPSFVDDVIEVDNISLLPASGEEGKIYIVIASGKTYRWAGTTYLEIVASPGSTDVVAEGSTNLYFTTTRAVSAVQSALNGKASTVHAHASTDITDFATAVAAVSPPSPDEVVEYLTPANFPATGNASLLYRATDSSRLFAWVGSQYAEVGPTSVFMAGHTHSASEIVSGTIAAARLGTHATTHNPGGSDPVTLVEVYEFTRSSKPAAATGSNGAYSFTLPSTAKFLEVIVISGGGGGASGMRHAAGTTRSGGGGGGPSGVANFLVNVASLPTLTATIAIGAGGPGGAAVSADSSNGNGGASGGATTVDFGIYRYTVGQGRGAAAPTSSSAAGALSSNASGQPFQFFGEGGQAGGVGAAGTNANTATNNNNQFKSGAGGGGINSSNTQFAGGSGAHSGQSNYGGYITAPTAPAAGAAGGGNGGSATSAAIPQTAGGSGAGGGGNASGAGGNGGTGAFGGGGGGGGASVNGFVSGAGGNGGDGYVRITVWY